MKFRLRPYQYDCILSTEDALKTHRSAAICMATGLGKACIQAALMQRHLEDHQNRCMIMAHRKELCGQLFKTMQHVLGSDVLIEVEQAEFTASGNPMFHHNGSCVVASVQTLTTGPWCRTCKARAESEFIKWKERNDGLKDGDWPGMTMGCMRCDGGRHLRLMKFKPEDFGRVFVDECHHGAAASYRQIIQHFSQNPDCRILGFTATPDRADGEALPFETQAYSMGIREGIQQGWLVPLEVRPIFVDEIDLSKARMGRSGDLRDVDIAKAYALLRAEQKFHKIVEPVLGTIEKRQTIVFAADVASGVELTSVFNRYQPGCAGFICSDTKTVSSGDRDMITSNYRNNKLQILVNVGICSEGWDVPNTGAIVLARPTASRACFAQMVGRGTRTLPNTVDGPFSSAERRQKIAASAKVNCLIIDIVGNAGRHSLITPADLFYEGLDKESREAFFAVYRKSTKKTIDEAMAEAREQQELDRKRILAEEAKRRAAIVANVKWRSESRDPFELTGCAQMSADRNGLRQSTPKQRQLLSKLGCGDDELTTMSFAEANRLTGTLLGRAKNQLSSLKQLRLLAKYGVNAQKMLFTDAGRVIEAIKDNGWRPISPEHLHSLFIMESV